MIERASGAWAAAQAPTLDDAVRLVGGEGRFTLRHRAVAPFEWSMTLERAGGSLAWALPAGVPWGEGEARPATAREASAVPDPVWDAGRYTLRLDPADPRARTLLLEGRRVAGRCATSGACSGRCAGSTRRRFAPCRSASFPCSRTPRPTPPTRSAGRSK